MLYVVDLYHLYHRLLKPHAFPRTVASLTKTSFWPVLQASPVYLYVIVQRVKVSLAILTDLNLLPYQTVIIQWRNFDKVICTKYNWTYPKKRNSRRNLILQVFFFFFFFKFSRGFSFVNWLLVDFLRRFIFLNLSLINVLYILNFLWFVLRLVLCESRNSYSNFSKFQIALFGYKRLNSWLFNIL